MMCKTTWCARPLARTLAAISLASVLAASTTAQAGITGVTGNGDILNPANTLTSADANYVFAGDGKNPPIHGWDEKQNFVLTKDVYVDVNKNNSASPITGVSQLSSLHDDPSYVIPKGTEVDSSLLYYSPPNSGTVKNVTYTFSNTILGVIIDSDRFYNKKNGFDDYFVDTDSLLGNPLTTYPGVHYNNRGLELGNPDSITVSIVGNTVTVNIAGASNPGDQIRVITAVPEPATLVMSSIGLVGAGLAARRRRAAKVS